MPKPNKLFTVALTVGSIVLVEGLASQAHAAILADSVADFQTNMAQGYNGWTYLEDRDNAAEALMTVQNRPDYGGGAAPNWSAVEDADHIFMIIWKDGGHPGGQNGTYNSTAASVRRWTSSYTGLVDIVGTAHLQTSNTSFTDGTSIGIYLNGVLLSGGTGSTINLLPSGDVSNPTVNFDFADVPISSGDKLDFALYGGQDLSFSGKIESDSTDMAATITSVPEPVSLGLLAVGAVLVLTRRKRV